MKTKVVNPFLHKPLTKGILKTIDTTGLLQKLHFVKKAQSGIFHYLPLGLRSLDKLSKIIDTRLKNDLNATEVSLSSLSPKALWEQTGRWNNNELFKLKDNRQSDYCLVATCEEDITELMREYVSSYKNMPVIVYQTTRKYRDEKRPRGGLLRGREFTMMDAYSFASTKQDSMTIFNMANETFEKIFKDLKVPFQKAWADNGDIGGDMSKEYHLVHESGEDTLFSCSNCDNVVTEEKSESFPVEDGNHAGDVDVTYALSKDHTTLVCYYYPKGRGLNMGLALKSVDNDIDTSIRHLNNSKIIELFINENEDFMFTQILRVMDVRLNSRSNFPDFPLKQYLKNNFGQIDGVSLVNAIEGELCGQCQKGYLTSFKSIEVGHTFNLGTKYTEPMKIKFADADNNSNSLVEMGCYGIGVTRIIGAIAEMTRDDKGFKWPTSISPYLVSLCAAPGNKTDEIVSKVKLQLKQSSVLNSEVFDSFNPTLGLGQRIMLSHAIGIPLAIIIGSKSWPNVEIEVRGERCNKPTWTEDYEKLKDIYCWEVSYDGEFEKHIIPHKHLNKISEILLRDM